MTDRSFYVYTHADANGVFYVGKGRGRRAFDRCGRGRAWSVAAHNGYSVEIVRDGLSDCDAKALEAKLIRDLRPAANVRSCENKPDITTPQKASITLTLSREVCGRLDAWIKAQEFPPAKNAVVGAAIREWLDSRA